MDFDARSSSLNLFEEDLEHLLGSERLVYPGSLFEQKNMALATSSGPDHSMPMARRAEGV